MRSKIPTLAAACLIGISLSTMSSSHGAVLLEDNFNRSNSTDLGTTSGGPYVWTETGFDVTNANPSNFSIESNRLSFNGSSGTAHDPRLIQTNLNLNQQTSYSVSFSLNIGSIQSSAAMFILPRAEGNVFPGNTGWAIVQGGSNSTWRVGTYNGDDFASTGNQYLVAPTLTAATTIYNAGTDYTVRIDVNGNTASLYIGDSISQTLVHTQTLNSAFNNDIFDTFALGYSPKGASNRALTFTMDDFVIVPEPHTTSLLALGVGLLAFRRKRPQSV